MREKLSEVVLILIGSTLVILILAALIVIALFVNQRRKFKYRQEMEDMKNTYEKEVLKTQVETQVQTFETISRELHDNIGTLLSIAIVQLKSAPNVGTSPLSKSIDEANQLLDEAMSTLRDISRSINPENIERIGLTESVRNELLRLKRTKMYRTEFHCVGEEFVIESQKKIILFRIVQEALNNIVKHSGANEVVVSVNFQEPSMDIFVRDNGIGFDKHQDTLGKSGLANMRKRASLIQAGFDIETGPNKGTEIHLRFSGQPRKVTEKPQIYGIRAMG